MLSIKNNDKYEETIKYSKFISLIFRVYSKEDVTKYLDIVKKDYAGANHYCFGYVIGENIKFSDDGEPSKTGGMPILKQIMAKNLNYVLIIVVRFFGGVKLGIGPLGRAYGKMAKEVIKDSNIINLTMGYRIKITFDYNEENDILYILKNKKIMDKKYEDKIVYHLVVDKDTLEKLKKYKVDIIEEEYIEKE